MVNNKVEQHATAKQILAEKYNLQLLCHLLIHLSVSGPSPASLHPPVLLPLFPRVFLILLQLIFIFVKLQAPHPLPILPILFPLVPPNLSAPLYYCSSFFISSSIFFQHMILQLLFIRCSSSSHFYTSPL